MSVPGTMGRPAYRLYKLAWAGLDWLYPPLCGGCGKLGSRWCNECQDNTRVVTPPICKRCGAVLDATGTICSGCSQSSPSFSALRAWAVFDGPLRNALHRLKYKGDVALGEILARPLISMLQDLKWGIDLVTAVPIGIARRAERGYNQAALLALPLAMGCGITYAPQALSKIRETRSQVGLNVVQRLENVSGAFLAHAKYVREKCVLVVDDVTTSGATIEACSSALLIAGAREVFGLTLARAA
jgi:ComF family protein